LSMPVITDDASRMPEFTAILKRALLTVATSRPSDVPEDEDAYASREWCSEDEISSMSVTMSADMVVVRSESTGSPLDRGLEANIHLKTDGGFHPHEPRCAEFVTNMLRRWIRLADGAVPEHSPIAREVTAALTATGQRICVMEEAATGPLHSGVRLVCDEIGTRHRAFLLPPPGGPFRVSESSPEQRMQLEGSRGLHIVIRCPDGSNGPTGMWSCAGAVLDCLTDEIDVVTKLRLLGEIPAPKDS
jgi:hypothetical protein